MCVKAFLLSSVFKTNLAHLGYCRDLHYAHQGGWRFELYDADLNMVSTWNDSSHWDCKHDGTQQSVELELPSKPCEGCLLRLQRQAMEWSGSYLFHSCAMVDVVEKSSDSAECNGCSGHGTCKEVRTWHGLSPITVEVQELNHNKQQY